MMEKENKNRKSLTHEHCKASLAVVGSFSVERSGRVSRELGLQQGLKLLLLRKTDCHV
jgi:hypothetical protein